MVWAALLTPDLSHSVSVLVLALTFSDFLATLAFFLFLRDRTFYLLPRCLKYFPSMTGSFLSSQVQCHLPQRSLTASFFLKHHSLYALGTVFQCPVCFLRNSRYQLIFLFFLLSPPLGRELH